MIDGIDEKPHFDRAVRGAAIRRNAKQADLPVDRDRALALCMAEKRANLAAKSQPVEKDRTARTVGKRNAPLLDRKMGDRHGVRVEGEQGSRPFETLRSAKHQRYLRGFELNVRRQELAAHERTQRKLDSQRIGAHRSLPARMAERDLLQFQCRRRQEADIDRTANSHVEPGKAGNRSLEGVAITSPINKVGANQCRQQHQDQRNRGTEQRLLHSATSALTLVTADVEILTP